MHRDYEYWLYSVQRSRPTAAFVHTRPFVITPPPLQATATPLPTPIRSHSSKTLDRYPNSLCSFFRHLQRRLLIL